MTMSGQLPLPVGLRDGNTLENFLADGNPEALAAVEALLDGRESFIYLWGAPGSGRSHLLEAVADAAARRGAPVLWMPLAAGCRPPLEALDGVGDAVSVVCLDDVDMIAGDARWEEAIFHLFNQLRARGACLAVSAAVPPAQLPIRLADLRSRLGSGLAIGLRTPDDDERLAILTFRAARRGLELPGDAGRYLLARASRRLDDLVALLARLDREALVHQRRLTLPFVRQVLAADNPPAWSRGER